MTHRPLNRETTFELWPHFDPGQWIDFNPSLVRLPSGQRYAVIRRDRVPPVPGRGTVWAVAVDERLQPTGRPFNLVADGEDPRAVVVGDRVLVFYVLFERDADSRITGTCMVLAEFDAGTEPWAPRAHFKLPKYPLGGAPAGSNPGWEKNWVPFPITDTQVALIYSHDPWQVLVLNVDARSDERRFEQAFRADGLHWPYGGVRGGTPPLPYRSGAESSEGELITFFHSSEVLGSRKSYMAGACVFSSSPPYTPLRMTMAPLLVAPYTGGMHRFGWPVAASVIFPLGAQQVDGGWQLLCGIDDGQIGSFTISASELEARLQPLPRPPPATVQQPGGQLALDAPAIVQAAGAPALDWPLLRFLAQAAPQGRTLLDVGGDGGLFMAGLAAGYLRVEAVATSASAAGLRARTVALGGLQHCSVHLPAGLTGKVSSAEIARPPWGLVALDQAGFIELDLLTAEAPDTLALLQGLRHSIARDRPAMLLLLREDGSERTGVLALLAELGYDTDTVFPRSPRALLGIHPSRRAELAWFV